VPRAGGVARTDFRLVGRPAVAWPASSAGLLDPRLRREIRQGLTTRPRRLPVECLYDEQGSALFDAITLLPEYGVTRAERRLLDRHRQELCDWLPSSLQVVELGSGSGETTAGLLEAHAQNGSVVYHPVDISRTALERCRRRAEEVGGVTVRPVEGTHEDGLRQVARRRLPDTCLYVLFLGSSFGNFERTEARGFLSMVREYLKPGDCFLLGVDLVKDEGALIAAYDDALGLTAAFNRNALRRINRELGGDFDPAAFAHRAVYDRRERRVEMHLVSERAQDVAVVSLGLRVRLERGETLWTESSHKFEPGEAAALAAEVGFACVGEWADGEWPFALSLLVAVPSPGGP